MRTKKIAILLSITLCCFFSCKNSNTKLANMSDEFSDSKNLDTTTFGNGCFWCTEAIFQQLEGVVKVTSGYSGGHVENPTYEEVCGKKTGHAEALNIVYDKTKISFD